MSLYVDSSALLKRYFEEDGSAECARLLDADPGWLTARHTWVEVVRSLAKLATGRERVKIEATFRRDWRRTTIVEIDKDTCERAADIGKTLAVPTLDALHLAALQRAGGTTIPILTYDLRQAQAARALGIPVLGT